MKWYYLNTEENRVVSIAKKYIPDNVGAGMTVYMVDDDFDDTKELPSEENPGTTVRLSGFLTAAEFLERYNQSSAYASRRAGLYPQIGEQLDKLWHDLDDGVISGKDTSEFYAAIKVVKDANPKPVGIAST